MLVWTSIDSQKPKDNSHSVEETLDFFDLSRGLADKLHGRLAHYKLKVRGKFVPYNLNTEFEHNVDSENQFNFSNDINITHEQDFLPYEFLSSLFGLKDLESFRLSFGLGEFDNRVFEFLEVLHPYKLNFMMPHQGSELFVKCAEGTDCVPDLGYL